MSITDSESVQEPAAGEDAFVARHVGPSASERGKMLAEIGYSSLDNLIEAAVPTAIRSVSSLQLPPALSEVGAAQRLRQYGAVNRVRTSMIGLGYYPTTTPPVVRRNVLEDPTWYTAYTPYQPEISQGRLEALLNFQTVVGDLTGLQTANASLLDEPTAVAEAVTLMRRAAKVASRTVLVDADVLPQTIEVLTTRCEPLGIDIQLFTPADGLPDVEVFGMVLSLPGGQGGLVDPRAVIDEAHAKGALVTIATDLLA